MLSMVVMIMAMSTSHPCIPTAHTETHDTQQNAFSPLRIIIVFSDNHHLVDQNLADFMFAIQSYECHTVHRTVQPDTLVDFLLFACQKEVCIYDSSSLMNMMPNSVVHIFDILSRWMQK